MLRRNLNSDFVGGAYVFPGGGVDSADGDARSARHSIGVDDVLASRHLSVASGGLAYYVAALRELFEEAGLLVVCSKSGEPAALHEPATAARVATYRRALNNGTIDFTTILEEQAWSLDLQGVAYLSHWVTPVGAPRRYDTRFFVVLAPSGQIAAHDAGETVEDQWIRPKDALAAHRRGEFQLIFPTIRTLESIEDFESAAQVLNYAEGLSEITRIVPRIGLRDGQHVIMLPGEPGYDD